MITKENETLRELLLNIFDTTSIQRWNDKLRPVNLVELDYQGHRMMIAYLLGKFEEEYHPVDWTSVIEGAIFDLLETAVLTDLKWDIKDRLNRREDRRQKKNKHVLDQLGPLFETVSPDLLERFRTYQGSIRVNSKAKKILKTASNFARWWEFQTFWPANPSGYEMSKIQSLLEADNERYSDMVGCQEILCVKNYRDFIELCAQLRFQGRWSYLQIVPRISVLGHSMFVAAASYIFSVETGACDEEKVANFLSGLFHDLEETQTRDVRGPLKQDLPELRDVVREVSEEMMKKNLLPLLPEKWRDEFRRYSMGELEMGSLVKAADDLSAIIEAYRAKENGCRNPALLEVKRKVLKKYEEFHEIQIGLVRLTDICGAF
jgi:putative hydrolase of HD superfamily